MRRSTATILVFCLFLPAVLHAAAAPEAVTSRVLSATPYRTEVRVDFDAAVLMQRVTQPADGERLSDGLATLLAIAGHGTPEARVVSWETHPLTLPAGALDESGVAQSPDELARLGTPAVFHDLRVVSLGFRPLLKISRNETRLVNSVTVEVTTSGAGGINEISDPVSFSSAFYPLYRSFVANLDQVYPEHSVRAPGRFLVLATQSRYNSFTASAQWQAWLDLKKRKGYTMQLVTVPDGSAATISQTIRDAYYASGLPDLEYVMMVGDVPEIASNSASNPEHTSESSVGDNPFFAVAGGDSLPDVLGGRVAALVPAQYVAYWNKVYRYEVEPETADMRWFQSVCSVAGNYSDGSGTFPVTPVWNVEWARQRMLQNGIVNSDTFYYHGTVGDPPPGTYTPLIRADIDSGVCAVIYRGWGGSQGWQYPVFTNDDVLELSNGRRMPAVFGIVCGSGNFAFTGGQCLGETFTTGSGTPNEPRGGIVFIGATDLHTNTRHNNAILSGIIEAMLRYDVRSAGALLMAGKLEGWRQFPLEQGGTSPLAWFYVLHVFNLLGDPETQIHFLPPWQFSVTHPNAISVGETFVPITVTANGQPVEGAVVTLRAQGSDTVSVRRTDAFGQVFLPVNFAAAGTAQLTVWKSRHFLRMIDIPVISLPYDPRIADIHWTAGADGLPNPGEQVSFTLELRNEGTSDITPAISISQNDPRLTVNTATATTPLIAPGATALSTALAITLSGELTDGERPVLTVSVDHGPDHVARYVEVPVAAPDPVIVSLTVNDGGNGILEPGESAPISVTILNAGHQAGANLQAAVHSHDGAISFADNTATWGSLPTGQSTAGDDPISVSLASGVTPGRQILLRFVFSQSGAVVARKNVWLSTGVVSIHHPTGPDGYGYYAYEDIDAAYAAHPTYDWIELDPAHGGSGATAHDVRDDTHFAVRLPAPFTFYGQAYDSAWICSNGWLSFERATIPEFRNWEIPSPIGPGAMVCPYWTDLVIDRTWPNNDSIHTVWTRYDAAQSRYVVQWRAFDRGGLFNTGEPNMAFCTFEVILKYGGSGDGDILCQYNQISNVDVSNNYASVGIQDSRHERGLGLSYANIYPPSADSLRAGRAILFTTTPPDNFSAAPAPREFAHRFALHEAYPNPFNPRTELRFDLPETGLARLVVYDILGHEVAVLADDLLPAGSHRVSFDGRDLPSGLYFARLTAGTHGQVRKLMLVK